MRFMCGESLATLLQQLSVIQLKEGAGAGENTRTNGKIITELWAKCYY